jgi:hypothetical protein
MATNRYTLTRGPGYLTYNSATTPATGAGVLTFSDDAKIEYGVSNDMLTTALQGDIDETTKDLIVKLTGTPLQYPVSQSGLFSWLFPFCNGVPSVGSSPFGTSDTPVVFLANNGDQVGIYNAGVVKMPDLVLDIGKPILGAPETANSYFIKSTGNSYTPPVLLQSGDSLGRQRYYGNWAAGNTATGNSTFSNFQGQTGFTISHELKLEAVPSQGRTVDYTLLSYRAMAKCVPIPGPNGTPSLVTFFKDIDTCMLLQGTGAKAGSRLSGGVCGDLIITGQNTFTGTIKNAVLRTAGFVFGGKPLRTGEIGFVGTFNLTTTTPTGGLNLA